MMEIEERIKELFESGKTKPYQIAKELQIDTKDVRKYLRKMVEEGKIESKHEIRKKQIRTLCEAGKTQEKIAEILKISPTTVSRYVRKLEAEGLDIKKQQRSKKKREQREEKIIRKEKVRLLYNDKTQIEIAKELDVSQSTVSNDVNELKQEGKIKGRPKKTKQQQEREEVVRKLYSNKKTYKAMSEIIGISVPRIYRIVSKLKAEGLIKERKITNKERLDEIERLYKAGKTQTVIAKKLGVSPTTINREIKKHGIVRENGELESAEELTNRKQR